MGGKLARKMAQAAVDAGFKPTQHKMSRPLVLQGVGNGTQSAEWEIRLPIAVNSGDSTELHVFESPTVEGTGEDLPALLGLRSIRDKDGVLENAAGTERLSFPGPGGYKIEWSPGTIHLPLTPAPSGHLVIPCDNYANIVSQGGLPPARTTLHATSSTARSTSTASPRNRGPSGGGDSRSSWQ